MIQAEPLMQELAEDMPPLLHQFASRGVFDERGNAPLFEIKARSEVLGLDLALQRTGHRYCFPASFGSKRLVATRRQAFCKEGYRFAGARRTGKHQSFREFHRNQGITLPRQRIEDDHPRSIHLDILCQCRDAGGDAFLRGLHGVAGIIHVILVGVVEFLVFACLVSLLPVGLVKFLATEIQAIDAPCMLSVEAAIAIAQIERPGDWLRSDSEGLQSRIQLAQRDQCGCGLAVDFCRFRRTHLPVNPCIGHVAANDRQRRVGFFLCENGLGKFTGITKANFHAREGFAGFCQNALHCLW